jgi:hypothetical protein
MAKIRPEYPLYIYDDLMRFLVEAKKEIDLINNAGVDECTAMEMYINKKITTPKGKYIKDHKVVYVSGGGTRTIGEYKEIDIYREF